MDGWLIRLLALMLQLKVLKNYLLWWNTEKEGVRYTEKEGVFFYVEIIVVMKVERKAKQEKEGERVRVLSNEGEWRKSGR